MLPSDQVIAILIEETTGRTPTIQGEEADKLRADIKKDLALAKEKGWLVVIPSEWESLDEGGEGEKRENPNEKGGSGSGNFGHSGRVGEVGGSASEGIVENATALSLMPRGSDFDVTMENAMTQKPFLVERLGITNGSPTVRGMLRRQGHTGLSNAVDLKTEIQDRIKFAVQEDKLKEKLKGREQVIVPSIAEARASGVGEYRSLTDGTKEALSNYPPHLQEQILNNVDVIKESGRKVDGASFIQKWKEVPEDIRGKIERTIVISKHDSANPRTGQLELTHEFAHTLDYSFNKSLGVSLSDTKEYTKAMLSGKAISNYAVASEKEHFAEHATAYAYAPKYLKEVNPEVHSFFNELWSGRREYTKSLEKASKEDLKTNSLEIVDTFEGSIVHLLAEIIEREAVKMIIENGLVISGVDSFEVAEKRLKDEGVSFDKANAEENNFTLGGIPCAIWFKHSKELILSTKAEIGIDKGGAGSGNFGHSGRQGEVGGSASSDSAGASVERAGNVERDTGFKNVPSSIKAMVDEKDQDFKTTDVDRFHKISGHIRAMLEENNFRAGHVAITDRSVPHPTKEGVKIITASGKYQVWHEMKDNGLNISVETNQTYNSDDKDNVTWNLSYSVLDERGSLKFDKGGQGSGNFGHSGRTGEVGGSSSEGGASWESRVQAYEAQGMTRSDAQGVVDAEDLKTPPSGAYRSREAGAGDSKVGGVKLAVDGKIDVPRDTFDALWDKYMAKDYFALTNTPEKEAMGIQYSAEHIAGLKEKQYAFMRERLTAMAKGEGKMPPQSEKFSWELFRKLGGGKNKSLDKGGQGSGNFGHAGREGERGGSASDGGGESKPNMSSIDTYSEHKQIVRDQMAKLERKDKESVKASAGAIYYRQENQSANYKNIDTKLGVKDSTIETVTAILGVSTPLEHSKGGAGSGNFGHAGREGERGGSAPADAGASADAGAGAGGKEPESQATNDNGTRMEAGAKELGKDVLESFKQDGGEFGKDYADRVGSIEVDGEAMNIIANEDDAVAIAEEQVRNDLENEPENFRQEWLQNFASISETDIRIISGEEADAYVDNIDDTQIIEDGGKQSEFDAIQEKLDVEEAKDAPDQEKVDALEQEKTDLVDSTKEDLRSERQDMVAESLEKDPIQYFVEEVGAYTAEDLMKQPFMQIDIDSATEDAVATDGWAHFLSRYDGDYKETDNGAVYFRRGDKRAKQFYIRKIKIGKSCNRILEVRPTIIIKEKGQGEAVNNEMVICKTDDAKRMVYGIFLYPEEADHDGDVISADDIEKVAHGFMTDYRCIDEMHKDVIEADIVESCLAWKDGLEVYGKKVNKGAWFGAVKVHDDKVWDKVKSGIYKGFSVRISGVREEYVEKGGAGSGNFGHSGREGQVGGSAESGSALTNEIARPEDGKPATAKNPYGKTVKVNAPHAVFRENGWEWRVLKTYQTPEKEKENPYARWFCAVKSPMTHGGYDMGDTYIKDVGKSEVVKPFGEEAKEPLEKW